MPRSSRMSPSRLNCGVGSGVAGAFTVLLFGALRDAEPWVACCLGATMMAVGVELTCYYYSFLFAIAFLYHKRREAGAILLGVTAMTGFLDWAPTRYLPDTKPWVNFKMPQWLDEQYMWMSIATLAGFIWILYRFGNVPAPDSGETDEAVPAEASGTPRRGGVNRNRQRSGRRSR